MTPTIKATVWAAVIDWGSDSGWSPDVYLAGDEETALLRACIAAYEGDPSVRASGLERPHDLRSIYLAYWRDELWEMTPVYIGGGAHIGVELGEYMPPAEQLITAAEAWDEGWDARANWSGGADGWRNPYKDEGGDDE